MKAQQLDITLEQMLKLVIELMREETGLKQVVRLRIRLKSGMSETWQIENR